MRIPSKISGLGCRTTELIRPYDGSASQKLEHFAVGGDDHIGLSVSGESSLTPRITAPELKGARAVARALSVQFR